MDERRFEECEPLKEASVQQASGSRQEVYRNMPFVGSGMNDRPSSLFVYPHHCLSLYEHSNYQGRHWRHCAGKTPLRLEYLGNDANDKVSSVRVEGSDMAATVFEHGNFGGEAKNVYVR